MRSFLPLTALLLATAACTVNNNPPADDNMTDNNIGAGDVSPTTDAAVSPATSPQAGNAVTPAPEPSNPNVPPPPHVNPVGPTPPAEASALGAARRLQEYCDAVATKRYRDAYGYWSDNGKATGMTLQQFRDSFAKYGAYDCHIGKPGDTEGAAGSVYTTIPLQVTGVLTKGGGFRLEGPVTMRRVNDVDGSSAEQRRWHIATSGLKPRP
jgi:hypothetical protein